ncbi:unnamed protein product [Gadus morhua 'NCC']
MGQWGEEGGRPGPPSHRGVKAKVSHGVRRMENGPGGVPCPRFRRRRAVFCGRATLSTALHPYSWKHDRASWCSQRP